MAFVCRINTGRIPDCSEPRPDSTPPAKFRLLKLSLRHILTFKGCGVFAQSAFGKFAVFIGKLGIQGFNLSLIELRFHLATFTKLEELQIFGDLSQLSLGQFRKTHYDFISSGNHTMIFYSETP